LRAFVACGDSTGDDFQLVALRPVQFLYWTDSPSGQTMQASAMENTMTVLETYQRTAENAPGLSLADRAARLNTDFDARAATNVAGDHYVAENYVQLKKEGLISAGVPVELGGGGAGIGELCDMIRVLGQGCGSTALSLAMHTHQVAIPAWRWRHQPAAKAAVEPVLRKVAATDCVLLTSGGNDWVGGAPGAEKVKGGYRITTRKVFVSNAPLGAMLITGAVAGDEVVHFALPMDAPEVKVKDTWHALGMCGTGSQDVVIDGFFLADEKVAMKRPAGQWHPVFQIIATVAMPIIYAAYLGVAEAARDIAIDIARKRKGAARNPAAAGEMETALRAAQLAHRLMVETAEANAPGEASVNEVMFGRRLVEENAVRAVGLAMELASGTGFYRAAGLERRFRDVQGARYHPMRHDRQALYAGSMALGDPVATIF
jgi:alkylation response protein AidB-like acyl-CoA dehydrogenase